MRQHGQRRPDQRAHRGRPAAEPSRDAGHRTSARPPPSLASCASVAQAFTFRAVDLVLETSVRFRVDVTSDQMSPAVRSQVVQFGGDRGQHPVLRRPRPSTSRPTPRAGRRRPAPSTAPTRLRAGPAAAGTFYFQSSSFLDLQCDEVQSPVVMPERPRRRCPCRTTSTSSPSRPATGTTGRTSAACDVATGDRTVVGPSGGRLYNASGVGGVLRPRPATPGWAAANPTWAASTWTAAALGSAGVGRTSPSGSNIKYGTDPAANDFGFRFDQVTLTDFNLKVADTQTRPVHARQPAAGRLPGQQHVADLRAGDGLGARERQRSQRASACASRP